MQFIDSPSGGARISRLVFGCAPAGGSVGRADALRAMHEAHDLGITAYDTARSYGYGESEQILGEFLRGRRDKIAVFSKAGIRSLRPGRAVGLAKDVARKVFSFAPQLRTLARSRLGKQHQGGHFEPEELKSSVDESLRALGVEFVDVLFLHDVPSDVARRDDVFELLERLVSAGKLGAVGVSGAPNALDSFGTRASVRAFQFAAATSLWGSFPVGFPPEPRPSLLRLGNRVFADLAARTAAGLSSREASEACLRAPLAKGVCDAIVASMYTREHLRANVRALDEPTLPEELLVRTMTPPRPTTGSSS